MKSQRHGISSYFLILNKVVFVLLMPLLTIAASNTCEVVFGSSYTFLTDQYLLSETILEERFGADHRGVILESDTWSTQAQLLEPSNYFRGMRLKPHALVDILQKGMKVDQSGHSRLNFIKSFGDAGEYSIFPGMGTLGRDRFIPKDNFVAVVFEVSSQHVQPSPPSGALRLSNPNIGVTSEDVPPDGILRIWIYDIRFNRFVEFDAASFSDSLVTQSFLTTGETVTYEDGTVVSAEYLNGVFETVKIEEPGKKTVYFERTNRSLNEYSVPTDLQQLLLIGGYFGKKVLDVGCGGGAAVDQMRSLGIDAHGVDIILDSAQRTRSYLHQFDMKNIGLPDSEFDLIISNFSFFSYRATRLGDLNYEEGLKVMLELKRLLAPGGKLVLGSTSQMDVFDIVSVVPEIQISGSGQGWVLIERI